MARFGDLPFPIAAILIAVASVSAVAAAVLLGAGAYWPVAFLLPAAIAVWYLYGYRLRPAPATTVSTSPPTEEPFEDPVEEADREAAQAEEARRAAAPEDAALEPPGENA